MLHSVFSHKDKLTQMDDINCTCNPAHMHIPTLVRPDFHGVPLLTHPGIQPEHSPSCDNCHCGRRSHAASQCRQCIRLQRHMAACSCTVVDTVHSAAHAAASSAMLFVNCLPDQRDAACCLVARRALHKRVEC